MKNLAAIFAMILFLAGSAPAWSQWSDVNEDSLMKLIPKVDDGFGGTWKVSNDNNKDFMWRSRSSNRIWGFPWNSDGRYYFNDNLEFDERSLPIDAGLPLAFYGYLTELNKENIFLTVYLYVNPETGEVDEVEFKLYGSNKIWYSVPPRNFTLYEDILKKTVKFKPPHGIFDPEKMTEWYGSRTTYREKPEDGIYYVFKVKFPAPAEGEPDFLALPTAADK